MMAAGPGEATQVRLDAAAGRRGMGPAGGHTPSLGTEDSGTLDEVHLSDPGFWLRPDREAVFEMLRRERPVSWQPEPACSWSPHGGRGYWAVTRWADVRLVSRDPETFGSGLGTEIVDQPVEVARTFAGMLNMDDPEHRALRRIV